MLIPWIRMSTLHVWRPWLFSPLWIPELPPCLPLQTAHPPSCSSAALHTSVTRGIHNLPSHRVLTLGSALDSRSALTPDLSTEQPISQCDQAEVTVFVQCIVFPSVFPVPGQRLLTAFIQIECLVVILECSFSLIPLQFSSKDYQWCLQVSVFSSWFFLLSFQTCLQS